MSNKNTIREAINRAWIEAGHKSGATLSDAMDYALSASPAPSQPAPQDDVSDPLARIETIVSEMGHADTLGFEEARGRILEVIAAARAVPVAAVVEAFQARVRPWMLACFGEQIAADTMERNHRFLEEALELVQACGCTASEAHQLVDYVYGRPVGERSQEVGGVMVTLAALCLAQGLDMHAAGETELARVWTKVDVIRAKQAAKPKNSPLPATPTPPQPQPDALVEAVRSAYDRLDTIAAEDGRVGAIADLVRAYAALRTARQSGQSEGDRS